MKKLRAARKGADRAGASARRRPERAASPTCLCIFVKEPRPGFVKTRLARDVGAGAAAILYSALARDTLRSALDARVDERRLLYSPGVRPPPAVLGLLPPRSHRCFRPLPQGHGGLGRRLARAMALAFADGFGRVIAIGTDAPALTPDTIERAAAALDTSSVVLGPATDGGYYLLGLRSPAPGLLRGIPWSTRRVLAATLARARAARLSVHLLEPLSDIDRLADLEELRSNLDQAAAPARSPRLRATRKALARIWTRQRP